MLGCLGIPACSEQAEMAVANPAAQQTTSKISNEFIAQTMPIRTIEHIEDGWVRVQLGPEGLNIDLPTLPVECRILGDVPQNTKKRCYQATQHEPEKALVTIWSNSYTDKGIFSDEAIQATFEGAAAGLLTVDGERRTSNIVYHEFKGFPAQTLRVHDSIEGTTTTGLRLNFAVDGGYFVVSVAKPEDSEPPETLFDRIKNSIQLSPMDFFPGQPFKHKSSRIGITPPDGWIQENPRHPTEIVRFRNLTKLIVIKAAQERGYQCADYRRDVARQFSTHPLELSNTIAISEFFTIQPVPGTDTDLKVVHYCWNTSNGAVALEGVAERATAIRWSDVFAGAAGTIDLPR